MVHLVNSGFQFTRCTVAIPNWLTAIGTVSAVIVALYSILRQERQTRSSQRIMRASNLTAWIAGIHSGSAGAVFIIRNGGSEPVFEFIATIVKMNQEGPESDDARKGEFRFRSKIILVPPGHHEVAIEHPGGGMNSNYVLEIAFRDAAGLNWVRKGNGVLQEIPCGPLRYYEIRVPTTWNNIINSSSN